MGTSEYSAMSFKDLKRKNVIMESKLPLTVNVGNRGEGVLKGMNKNISELKNLTAEYPLDVNSDERHVVFSINQDYITGVQEMFDNLDQRASLLSTISEKVRSEAAEQIDENRQQLESTREELNQYVAYVESMSNDMSEMNRNNIQELRNTMTDLSGGVSELAGLVATLAAEQGKDFAVVKSTRKMVWWLYALWGISTVSIAGYLIYQGVMK